MVFTTALLVSCGYLKDPGTPLAKVKNQTLTMEDIRARGETRRDSVMAMVEAWVNEEVLVQEALTMGLNKQPDVAALLKSANRKILLDAYMRNFSQGVADPEEGELEAYFEAHRKEFVRETKDVRFSMVVFPELKQASDVYKARSTLAWGDLRMRMDSTLKDSSIGALPWVPVKDLNPCVDGIIATLSLDAVSLPQLCDGKPILIKLHDKKDVGDPLTYTEARETVLTQSRALRKSQKLDSLLQEAKSRLPVFTWPENLPKKP